jgi:hypothetical protein
MSALGYRRMPRPRGFEPWNHVFLPWLDDS